MCLKHLETEYLKTRVFTVSPLLCTPLEAELIVAKSFTSRMLFIEYLVHTILTESASNVCDILYQVYFKANQTLTLVSFYCQSARRYLLPSSKGVGQGQKGSVREVPESDLF